MNEQNQTRFEQRLNNILSSSEADIDQALDSLDDESEDNGLHLPTTVEIKPIVSAVEEENLPKDLVDDYKHVRNVLYNLIDKGTVALEGALIIARESEHPRAFEVSSGLMKNISDVAKELLSLQKALNPEVKIGKQINQQNNFYGESEGDQKDLNDLLDELDE
jgi:hypothetical protein